MTQESSTFSSLNLCKELLNALEEMKFHTPSPIQLKTIPVLLQGKDVIGLAQTGTGKTAAFALPILQQIQEDCKHTQALILAPTRELAIQVGEQISQFCTSKKHTSIAVICGGQDYKKQLKQLKSGAQIVIGTPGRILDHLERKSLKLDQINHFVLDEADEMLRMGFIEDVETILEALPKKKQVALFSATMPSRIRRIANNYLNQPELIEIKSKTATVKAIKQQFLFASEKQKPAVLLRIMAVEDYQGAIVFVRTKSNTEEIAQLLQKHQYRAMAIHGDLSQPLRERIISQFRQGAIDILVATDVAARGLDVERVTHVINYDIPFDCETYVHRIGRTGRAGRSGTTILFVTPKEPRLLNAIERHTRQRIEKIAVPNDEQITKAREEQFLCKISQRLDHANLSSYRKLIEDFIEEKQASAIDVAAALALLIHQDKNWHDKSGLPELTESFEKTVTNKKDKNSKKRSNNEKQFIGTKKQDLFRINVGKVHGVKPGNIVGAIANEAGLRSRDITGLKILDDHSVVRLPKGLPKDIIKHLTKAWVCGRQLGIRLVEC